MKIIDLTVLKDQQKMTALFEHYFRYWGKPNSCIIQAYPVSRIQYLRNLALSRLPNIEKRFHETGLPLDCITVALMVGQGTSNGHALLMEHSVLVWLALESYASKKQMDVFFAHEIGHGLHYLANPDFFFNSREEKNHIGRQIITEGIATYITEQVMHFLPEDALWADYVESADKKKWVDSCTRKMPRLLTFVRTHWRDTDGSALDLFYANDPMNIFKYRAGYFLGRQIIHSFVRMNTISLKDLLRVPRQLLEEFCLHTFKL